MKRPFAEVYALHPAGQLVTLALKYPTTPPGTLAATVAVAVHSSSWEKGNPDEPLPVVPEPVFVPLAAP